MLLNKLLFSFLLMSAAAGAAFGQIVDGDGPLDRTAEQSAIFRETFRNLIADESKTFASFGKDGNPGKRTTVKSALLIYVSKADRPAELRVVKEVDGTPIPDAAKRGEEFLAEMDRVKTDESLLKKLEKESTRHDPTYTIYGLALHQGNVLDPWLRKAFMFAPAGESVIDGHRVMAFSYAQSAPNDYVAFNSKPPDSSKPALIFDLDLPKSVKRSDLRLFGTIWVDVETYRIRKEERGVYFDAEKSVPLLTERFEYADSEFGILLPRSISLVFNELKRKDGKYTIRSHDSVLFEYSNYRKTNVEVKISDDDS